ncbi:MAG: cytochrome c [Thermoanaerobaculia bacterium]|nr:cytochrome c [Thermoanaerobaculia bacterium]
MIPDLLPTPIRAILPRPRLGLVVVLSATLLFATGCRQDMHDQPKYEPLEQSDFFGDGQASRLPVEGTVARGSLRQDSALYTGLTADGIPIQSLPITLDRPTLERGQVVYEVYCAPCHGRTGAGDGMIVRRGFKRPESFHAARLRQSPPGYFFQVVTNGFGEMSSYAGQVAVADRWAAIAYVRALQLSQAVSADALSEADRRELERSAATAASDSGAESAEEPTRAEEVAH